jgi:acyl-CoA synthetase (AMP-forming)/AMP-acid ligase II/alkylation response protein AidB-like acyl-CoA dehydrogenase
LTCRDRFGIVSSLLRESSNRFPINAEQEGGMEQTLGELLRAQSRERPDELALAYLKNGEQVSASLTFAELDREARMIAGWLLRNCERGEPVLLLYPAGVELVAALFGCIYARNIGIASNMPKFDRDRQRLLSIARDAGASVVLGTADTLERVRAVGGAHDFKALVPTDVRDSLAGCEAAEPLPARADDPAYLQYTSGSTSVPRGVVVTHASALHNVASLKATLDVTERSVFVTWLPHSHDLGLVYGLLLPLFAGAKSYIMTPSAFVQRPSRWLSAVSTFRGTHTASPNFAFDLCVQRTTPAQREGLDLSSWRVAANGAEPIRKATHDSFFETFREYGFRRETLIPVYGLAEATLIATCVHVDTVHREFSADAEALEAGRSILASRGPQRTFVSCGPALEGLRVEVVSPETGEICPRGSIGEIWVMGPSVAAGYWRRPDESEQTFGGRLSDGSGPFLKTGDLGFEVDGEIYIAGRRKDLVIINGRNIYPQDVELATEQSHPFVRANAVAAFSVLSRGEEALVIVAESAEGRRDGAESTVDRGQEVIKAIRSEVSQAFDVAVHDVLLVRPGSVGKTTSGKVQRKACRSAYLMGRLGLSSLMKSDPREDVGARLEAFLGPAFDSAGPGSLAEALRHDELETFPARFHAELFGAGALAYLVPTRLGGKLDRFEDLHEIWRVVARRDLGVATSLLATLLGAIPLWLAGSPEQQRDGTEHVLKGSLLAFGLTERNHGSDVLAGELRAERCPDGYELTGEKWLIGNASPAERMVLLAKTSETGGPRGFSLFAIEKASLQATAYASGEKLRTNGIRGTDIGSIAFARCFVRGDTMVGAEGTGFETVLRAFQISRCLVPALSLGVGDTALRTTLRFLTKRQLYGTHAIDIPSVRSGVARAFARLLLAECMAIACVRSLQALPDEMSIYSAAVKYMVPTIMDRMLIDLAALLGARHFLREEHDGGVFSKLLRDHTIVGVFDGSTAVNLSAIANQLPRLTAGWRPASGHGVNLSTALRLSAKLPGIERPLSLVNGPRDSLMAGGLALSSSLREELESVSGSSKTYKRIVQRAEAWALSVDRLMADIARCAERPHDAARDAEMASLAERYCRHLMVAVALQLWRENRILMGGFFAAGAWLVLGIDEALPLAGADESYPEAYDRISELMDALLLLHHDGLSYSIRPKRCEEVEATPATTQLADGTHEHGSAED